MPAGHAMKELDDLARHLQQSMVVRAPLVSGSQGDAMTAVLARVRDAFGERLAERVGPRTNRALLAFRLAPQTCAYVDLRLACRALVRPADWEQRRLIDDERLLAQLLARVEALRSEPRRHRACVAALTSAAAGFGLTPAAGERHLLDWLAQP